MKNQKENPFEIIWIFVFVVIAFWAMGVILPALGL